MASPGQREEFSERDVSALQKPSFAEPPIEHQDHEAS